MAEWMNSALFKDALVLFRKVKNIQKVKIRGKFKGLSLLWPADASRHLLTTAIVVTKPLNELSVGVGVGGPAASNKDLIFASLQTVTWI